jgi:hypothetical protein
MSSERLDISDALNWEEGLPRPQWDLIAAWVESRTEPDRQREAWVETTRQWLTHLGQAFGPQYEMAESDEFQVLGPTEESSADALVWFAGKCRERLLSILGGVANFDIPGKQIVIALREQDEYYQYISGFCPEGEQGGSAGMHIREGYPHVVALGWQHWMLENHLAHELTHVALHLREMPQWLEEGLAQMFEHDMTGRGLLQLDSEMAGRHKRYWTKHGLDVFWRGEGFSRPGKVQELSYQLAEILVRLLVEDSRPRWFGLVREPQQRYWRFLHDVAAVDCGQEAAREDLGIELSDLAARFLGAGEWNPSL